MIDYKNHQYLTPIFNFLQKINIPVILEPIMDEMFLPGILIKNGALIIDLDQLKYPGDVLHEAGHLAVTPKEIRSTLSSPIDEQPDYDATSQELMTLAWSYAAALDANIPLEVLFHPEGYKGGGESLIENFQAGRYVGLPMLQWLDMTVDAKNAIINAEKPFPYMKNWLRP